MRRPTSRTYSACTSARARVWTAEEQRLFQEIGRRLSDAISALSILRSLRDSERKLDAAQRIAHVGWWERDFGTNRVALSEEVQQIFGVRPVDLPHWQDRLFISLARSANDATDYFQIPTGRVVEIGTQVTI